MLHNTLREEVKKGMELSSMGITEDGQKTSYSLAAWGCNHFSYYKSKKNKQHKEHPFEWFTGIICFHIFVFWSFHLLSLQSLFMWKLKPTKAVQLQYIYQKYTCQSSWMGHKYVEVIASKQAITLHFFW